MINAGFTIENSQTKSRTTVLEINDKGWLIEVRCPPHVRADIAEHYHKDWTETFEIISGTAHYKFDGVKQTAQAGEKIVMPPGHLQMHPWNAGDTEMVYRQSNSFAQPNPDAARDVLGTFATIAGLAREGKVDHTGRPKHPLQMAATLKTLVKYGGYDASMSAGVQDFLAATLGSLAEALGYKAIYPQYVGDK